MQRRIKNVVNNYTATEIKVREATSNDPWGPSSILMSEISTLTFDVLSRGEVMGIVWKRLNDHGKNWRHVYKSLVLLNFLVRTGSDWVVRECHDNIIFIQTLRDFQYSDNGLDCGLNIREAAKKLYELLKDERKLREERHRAHKSKLGESRIYSSSIGDLASEFNTQSSHLDYKAETIPTKPSSPINSQATARPTRATNVGDEDEDEELRLALALSKEEHDAEEMKRRNDEVRLKMALEESKRTAQLDKQRIKPFEPSLVDQEDPWKGAPPKHPMDNPWNMGSHDDDVPEADNPRSNSSLLLGLTGGGRDLENFPSPSDLAKKASYDDFDEIIHRGFKNNGDPYSTSINSSSWMPANHSQAGVKSSSLGDLLSSLNGDLMFPSNDNDTNSSVINNNVTNNNVNSSVINNSVINNNVTNNNVNNVSDPFGFFDNNGNENNNKALSDVMGGSNLLDMPDTQQEAKAKKKTAEAFLGDNAKLVNLEQLVVMPTKQDTNNPFAITTTKTSVNPFSHLKQPQKVPLNQLQASSQPPVQSAAFMQFDNSTYHQPANQLLPNQTNLPPSLPQHPPTAFTSNYNPFL